MPDVLIYADTGRSPEMRHEVPLLVPDPFLYVERDGSRHVVLTAFELDRIRALEPSPDYLPPARMKRAVDATAAEAASAISRRFAMRAAWGRWFEDHDAFLMPADFVPAFPHDHGEPSSARVLPTPEGPRRYDDQLFWISFATMTGLPATVAPIGLTPGGLPVGIQIVGPWLEDATPIFVAEALEKEFGFRIPKGFE